MNKQRSPKSFRLTEHAETLLEGLSQKFGLKHTGVMELAIRQMADREGVKARITGVSSAPTTLDGAQAELLNAFRDADTFRTSGEFLEQLEDELPEVASVRANALAERLDLLVEEDVRTGDWVFREKK